MSNNSSRVHTTIDSDLYAALERDMLEFKLMSNMQKRSFVEKTDWNLHDWKCFLESSIRKWNEDKVGMRKKLWEKKIILDIR